MEQNIILLGILLIFIGVIIIFIGALAGSGSGETKVAVGGFIGPIPFGFANDPKMMKFLYILMLSLIVLFFVFPIVIRYLAK